MPTDAEWSTLITYLGGESIAGGKLKEIGTTHWASPNTGATNETGFTGLPGGVRVEVGSFSNIGYIGYWWSCTEINSGYAWYRRMHYDPGSFVRNGDPKLIGGSIRCVKD